ncbi:MAG TPA: hypothetical protein PL048_00185 [Leptospiraceae bacterium]|nr:hypothetical protein [Leptospiraceae bacterium]HMY65195.1 hypothetical protein [Leptospiraceae bacterium]HMZ57161.1 hypothetical protein [Leptospiraceae bacterium]HNF12664.1 hypothetical protein [Leptospiraceae bacterium]HNF23284.1 hypothetical protein [Leptospiraceae bacterium]
MHININTEDRNSIFLKRLLGSDSSFFTQFGNNSGCLSFLTANLFPSIAKKREFMSGKFALAAGGSRGIGKSAEIKSAEQG